MPNSAAPNDPLVDLRIMGPLAMTVGGAPVQLGGPRQMAVLARLILAPGQVVSTDQLVEAVWDGDAPAQPTVAIRSYVSNLRRAIEPNRERRSRGGFISAAPGGYRLEVSEETIDWCRFEALVRDGRERLEAGDPDGAVAALRRAGSLWRGEFGAGLPDSETFFAHRSRLDEMRHTARELLFEARLAGGDHVTVAAEIEGAIGANPLRERLTELGMLAMYRAGRQSDALGLGRQLRARLLDQLGVDPSPAVVDLEVRILNHDPALDPLTGTVSARFIPGSGTSGGPSVETSPFATPAMPGSPDPSANRRHPGSEPAAAGFNLKNESGRASTVAIRSGRPFVGRDRELAALDVVLDEIGTGRSATAFVTGEPGAGRSALVTAFGRMAADRGIRVFSGRGVEGVAAPLWPFSQLLSELAEYGAAGLDELPDEVREDLVLANRLTAGRTEVESTTPDGDPGAGDPADGDPGAGDPADGHVVAVGDAVAGPVEVAPLVERVRHDQTVAAAGVAIARVLRRIAAREPLAVVFDDVQWADGASVSLIELLAASLRDVPVAIVATWRASTGSGATTADLHRLELLEPTVRIGLAGVDRAAVARMVRDTGFDGTEADIDEIDRASGGNPQLVRALIADRLLGDAPGSGPAVEAAMMAWTEGLTTGGDRVLVTAAVFGGGFTAEDVAEIVGGDPDDISTTLTAAVRSGLVVDPGFDGRNLRFRHPALAEALLVALPPTERSRLEGSVGRLLASRADRRSSALEHLARSDRSDDRADAIGRALERFDPIVDGPRAGTIDRWIGDLLADPDSVLNVGSGPGSGVGSAGDADHRRLLEAEARTFLAWRRWLDGRAVESRLQAIAALRLALGAELAGSNGGRRGRALRSGTDRAGLAIDIDGAIEGAALAAMGRFRYPGCALAAIPPPELLTSGLGIGLGIGTDIGIRIDPGIGVGKDIGRGIDHDPEGLAETGLDPGLIDLALGSRGGAGDLDGDGEHRAFDEVLRAAAARFPAERPIRWQLLIHLLDRSDPGDPPVRNGRPSGEGKKLLADARRRLGDGMGPVASAFLERFWVELARTERSRLLEEMERSAPSVEERVRLIALRLPDLLGHGSMVEAERSIRALSSEAAAAAQPYARLASWVQLLRILLWRGDVEEAARLWGDIETKHNELGLSPGPMARSLQREVQRLERGPEAAAGDLARLGPVERAIGLADLGAIGEARDVLDRILDRIDRADGSGPVGNGGSERVDLVRRGGLHPATAARIAAAAARIGHDGAGRFVFDDLEAAGDRLIVDPSGGAILGPASLYAGLAALAAGKPAYADALLAQAADRARDTGGQTALIRALVARLEAGAAPDDTISLLRVEALTVAEVSGMATAFVAALSSVTDADTDGRNQPGGDGPRRSRARGRSGSNQVPTNP